MSTHDRSVGIGREIRRSGTAQRSLRVAVFVGPLVAIAAGSFAAAHVLVPVVLVVAVLAAGCAITPDTNLGLLVTIVIGWHWAGSVHDPLTAWVLLAAGGLLVFHVAMALAATAPARAGWPAASLARWGRRTALVAAITIAAWSSTLIVDAIHVDGGVGLLVVAATALGLATLVLRNRSTTAGQP